MNNRCLGKALLLVTMGCGVSLHSLAAGFDVIGELGVGRTDNIGMSASNPEGETIGLIGLLIRGDQRSSRLQSQVVADLAYQEYFNNTYDGELVGSLAASSVFSLVPERLQWTLQDNYGQTRPDIFSPATPENRETINYFSTGPDVSWRVADQTYLTAGGRYARADYELSPFDSQRYAALLGLSRQISSSAAASLHVRDERIDFSRGLATADYDTQQLFGRYSLSGSRTTGRLELGANRLQYSSRESTGTLVRIELTRRLSGFTSLTVRMGRELTDAAGSLQSEPAFSGAVPTTLALSSTGNPFVSTFVGLAASAVGSRTQLAGSVQSTRERNEVDSSFDRTVLAANMQFVRRIAANVSVSVSGSYGRYDYRFLTSDVRELQARTGVQWNVGPRMSLELAGERTDRSADAAGSDAVDNRYWLTIRYSFLSQDSAGQTRPAGARTAR